MWAFLVRYYSRVKMEHIYKMLTLFTDSSLTETGQSLSIAVLSAFCWFAMVGESTTNRTDSSILNLSLWSRTLRPIRRFRVDQTVAWNGNISRYEIRRHVNVINNIRTHRFMLWKLSSSSFIVHFPCYAQVVDVFPQSISSNSFSLM